MKPRLRILLGLLVSSLSCVGLSQVDVTPTADQAAMLKTGTKEQQANKRLVYDFWRTVFEGGHLEEAAKFMDVDYIQHNPTVATGRDAFVKFFGQFMKPKKIEKTIQAPLVAIIADGDLVVLSFARKLPDPKDPKKFYVTTWFDMLRVKNGKIAEHWDPATKG